MRFIRKHFFLTAPTRVVGFLASKLEISNQQSARLIDKGKVYLNGKTLSSKGLVCGNVDVICSVIEPANLAPIYESDDFAAFEKPSGMLIHPNGASNEPTLIDSAKALFGSNAQAVHRLDRSTSGVVLAAKNKTADSELKDLFASNVVKKSYLLYAKGKVANERLIDAPILAGNLELNSRQGLPKVMGRISPNGKPSRTMIYPIKYIKAQNITLISAIPATGRTHQIRLHLSHIGHPILGDCLYGKDIQTAHQCLNGELSREQKIARCGAARLLLHAQSLSFFYGTNHHITSTANFDLPELLQAATS